MEETDMENPQVVQEVKSGEIQSPGVTLPPVAGSTHIPVRDNDDENVSARAKKWSSLMTTLTIIGSLAAVIGLTILGYYIKGCDSSGPVVNKAIVLINDVDMLKKDVANLKASDNTILTNITNVEKKVDRIDQDQARVAGAVDKLMDRIEGLETGKADRSELGSYAKAKRLKRVEDRLNRHLADVANNGGETEKPTPAPVATVPPAPAESHKVTYQPKPYVVPVYKFKK